jgi:23S rRNA (adenine2503-C2)-methyltransferase
MPHLLEQSSEQLKTWLAGHGQSGYRAGQVRRWLFQRRAESFEEMTDLPEPLREQLAAEFQVWTTHIAAHRRSDDGSEKLLLQLADGQRIECVLLRDDREHATACVSSQVGCGMGCAFCATGIDGVERNLTAGEIVEQLLRLQQTLRTDERLSNIVMMGMGEPLANLDRVLEALTLATAKDALGISSRRVTISTVGLPPGIRRLAERNCQYHLAVSLHAADDELRNRLVPANRKIGIAALLSAADEYFARTRRRLTFEYVLLRDVNDSIEDAKRLVALLRGRAALVNLIPYNPVAGLPFRTPSMPAIHRFLGVLVHGRLNAVVRFLKGDRIDAACGQLRRGKGDGGQPRSTRLDRYSATVRLPQRW